MTVLEEIERILNSKDFGYATSDIADSDSITPNLLVMGRWDASHHPMTTKLTTLPKMPED